MEKIQPISDELRKKVDRDLKIGENGTIFYDTWTKTSYVKFKDNSIYLTTDIIKDWLEKNRPHETYISPFTYKVT